MDCVKSIGVLGGSFDPVHNGHLALAQAALDSLPLDMVIFIPAFIPPHKQSIHIAKAEDRLAMLRLALETHPHFYASDIELRREGVSYTVDTLRELRKCYTQLTWLAGGDTLLDMKQWYKPEEIFQLCRVAAINRPGYSGLDAEIVFLEERFAAQVERVSMLPTDISSSAIRNLLRKGEDTQGLLPANVLCYIREHHLYEGDIYDA